jgi:rhodanese-related sulfurtransferase
MDKDKRLTKWAVIALAGIAAVLFFRSYASAEGGISPAQAASMIKETKNLQLIDVRTPGEYAQGHLDKAKLIPLQELESRFAEIDKSKPVLLYCRSGHRSGIALKLLQGKGYTQAKHMDGGINAWTASGLPVTQ